LTSTGGLQNQITHLILAQKCDIRQKTPVIVVIKATVVMVNGVILES